MENIPNCPQCSSEYVYHDGSLFVCPECGLEFQPEDATGDGNAEERVYKDSNGNVLNDGDTVVIIKDLKVKGASSPLKKGTKVKNIRLIEPADGEHDIDCKIPGFGSMLLKSSIVKKS
ncbi:MAG: zinc ribbon domain-containing protein YjdM [Desulfovibrio sp.]|uniref:zinc ribbon domain-containing protein YjdM n=1 Tax=Desulfovibrio sp. 7SRBS1 TaxID=3378064 RepID=UPI003B3C6EB9